MRRKQFVPHATTEQEDGWSWEDSGEGWQGRVSEHSVRLVTNAPSSYPWGHIFCGDLGVPLPPVWSCDQLGLPLKFHWPLFNGYRKKPKLACWREYYVVISKAFTEAFHPSHLAVAPDPIPCEFVQGCLA